MMHPDIPYIFNHQRAFFETGETLDIQKRKEYLSLLSRLLQSHEKELCDAIFQDFGKGTFEAFATEFALLYADIKEAKSMLFRWAQPRIVGTNLFNWPGKSTIHREPYGVCLIIGAWNYPIQLSLAPAIAALAAGNTVMLKPSELPAQTSSVLARMINDHFPPEVFRVIEGDVEVTTTLLNQRFDYIFFTGSERVGRIVYEQAAKQLIPVTLELGGKSPCIVMEDCHVQVAARRIVWGKFLNAGQTCIAPDYVFVQKSVRDAFLNALKLEIERNAYSIENGNYVQIINQKNMDRLSQMIPEEGVFWGGEIDFEKRTISPTILIDQKWDAPCMQEEIFGPILPVFSVDTLDEAIKKIKEKPKPLALYLFSRGSSTEKKVIQRISFGGGCINDTIMHITNSALPFGGVGTSGLGQYHGEAGFKTFSHEKSMFRKPTFFELKLKYPPYSESKLNLLKRFVKWLG
jgi:aldehyde dehydrogenase (NAD+)